MQQAQSMGDGHEGGNFTGAGDRKLRLHNHQNHQALMCPRCHSLDTKFCYYNNYNLSQPRHLCKSCRRYWTKGGILRNVPVGGGCRKTKRSKTKISANSFAGDKLRQSKSNAQNSSESTCLTASATATTPSSSTVEEGLAPSNTTSNSTVLHNFRDSKFLNVNPESDHRQLMNRLRTDSQILSTEIGSFRSLMTLSDDLMTFGTGEDIPTTSYGLEPMNYTPVAENPSQTTVDWGGGNQGQFDLTAGVDPAYWSQSEWKDNDQSVDYLL